MERVSFVLDKLLVSSPHHHDVRILRHVRDHADKDGYLSVQYRYALVLPVDESTVVWVFKLVRRRPGLFALPSSM